MILSEIMAEINSKHGILSRAPYEVYMAFADLRNFMPFIPEDKREGITADYDSIHGQVQGFPVGIRITDRQPYSKISLADDGAPFQFTANLCFDAVEGESGKTDFHIDVDADLNFMMKMLLGSKLQEALDKAVDSMVQMSQRV